VGLLFKGQRKGSTVTTAFIRVAVDGYYAGRFKADWQRENGGGGGGGFNSRKTKKGWRRC